jgi:hypothetical protein
MRFEVLTAAKISMLVLRVVMPCGLVGTYRRFGEAYCFHLQGRYNPKDRQIIMMHLSSHSRSLLTTATVMMMTDMMITMTMVTIEVLQRGP